MSIAWGSLLVVFGVTFGVAVVVLVSLGLVGPPARVDAKAGTVISGLCLLVAAAIIAFGVYTIVV